MQAWPEIVIGAVIKKTAKKQVVEVIRRTARGTIERAEKLLALSAEGIKLNTAFIERFNGTMRERLASLARRSRDATRRLAALEAGMWLVGCTYNWCWLHHELSRRLAHVGAGARPPLKGVLPLMSLQKCFVSQIGRLFRLVRQG